MIVHRLDYCINSDAMQVREILNIAFENLAKMGCEVKDVAFIECKQGFFGSVLYTYDSDTHNVLDNDFKP